MADTGLTAPIAAKRDARVERKRQPNAPKPKTVDAGEKGFGTTIRNLWPYMWPAERPDLKVRVVWATVFLVVAKLVTVLGALFLQMGHRCADRRITAHAGFTCRIHAGAVTLVIAYNVARIVHGRLQPAA